METKLTEIEEKIYEKLTELLLNCNGIKNHIITRKIKEIVGEIGEKKGNEIASNIHDSEWLYDIVWYKDELDKNGDKVLLDVPLIMESEISDRSINGLRYDFEKLLLAKPTTKVFLCMAEPNYSKNAVKNVKDKLEISFEKFMYGNKENDRVLLLIWDDYNTGKLFPYIFQKNTNK